MFRNFLKQKKFYNPEDIEYIVKRCSKDLQLVKTGRKKRYYNVPTAFDIETTSFYQYGEKCAIMYEWSFCFDGLCIVGRTWDQFTTMCDKLVELLDLGPYKSLIIYVHNLAYEFQFIRKRFNWDKVFALKSRTPIYGITDDGIEFRCSLILSGYSLAKVGDNLMKYKVSKMVGDLDYAKLRHSKTHLTKKELGYCINDVKVVAAYIQEQIEQNKSISKIPLTKTGFVRRFCRSYCLPDHNKKTRCRYSDMVKGLTLDPEEYMQLKRAFQGGFTHAGTFYSGTLQHDVTSFDFTSSYPTVMLSEKYPMSRAERVQIKTRDDLVKNLKLYCCLFDVTFYNLKPKIIAENYISISRCFGQTKDPVINNGRVVSAKKLTTTLTEQDYFIIKRFYTWDKMKVFNFKRYKKDYLPSEFMLAILKLYGNKTKLKGVDGKEAEYMHSKEMLNSCYGMAVTDIVRDEITYTDDWQEEKPDLYVALDRYNKSRARFLFYPWGVWVTAYARKNLFTGILACQEDYIYSDTDSIKVLNGNSHMEYINGYNDEITKKLRLSMTAHKLDPELTAPKTIKGVKKPLGVWDFDGFYSEFKTLGAKRYAVRYADDKINGSAAGKYSITVSGLNKKVCVPYLLKEYGDKFFDAFTDDLYVPSDYTGKMTHTYIDDERRGILTDYKGVTTEYDELSAVHLEKSDYSLSLMQEYLEYLRNVQEDEW